MSQSWKIFLFLSISICLAGCKTPYKCFVSSEVENFNFEPVINLVGNEPVLYSSQFEIMKYKFSGLIAFRHMLEDDETRIVFLSETGMKLMEFNYKNDEISNSYCISFVNRKRVIIFVNKFLLMLISKPDCKDICLEKTDEKSVCFCKNHRIKLKTETRENHKISFCFSKGNGIACGVYTDSEELPETIEVKMSHNTRINLKKVNNAFK